MSTFGNAARLDVLLPCPIFHDQRDSRVTTENFQRSIRTRVIICNDRIDMLADVVERIAQN